MASIARLGLLGYLRNTAIIRSSYQARYISTSRKNRDTTTVNPSDSEISTCEPTEKTKNWISYGFSETSEEEDTNFMHSTMFFGITVCFIFGGFLLAYRPEDLGRDWAQREGFLELRRREKFGLPLVDPNYIPLEKIIIPTDEELGDTEIIV